MSFWKSLKDNAVRNRLDDEAFHASAMREINQGIRRDGLWVKALVSSGGDEARAKVNYLGLLVSALRDESYMDQRIAEISAAQQQVQQQRQERHDRKERQERQQRAERARLQNEEHARDFERNRPPQSFGDWVNVLLGAVFVVAIGVVLAWIFGW